MGDSGQLGNQEEPHDLNRKGLLSRGSNSIAMKSRVNREVQARFCERLEVKALRPTRPFRLNRLFSSLVPDMNFSPDDSDSSDGDRIDTERDNICIHSCYL